MLKEKLNEYILQRQMVGAISQENERLRRWMGFKSRPNFEFIPAQIVYKNLPLWFSAFTIDKSDKDGAEKNSVILAFQDSKLGLVGRVIKTYRDTSEVLLISDPSSEVAARVQRSGEEGIVAGTGSRYLKLIYLETHADVKVYDKIVTSGYGGIFPPDILIGYVKEIYGGTFRLQKTAVVIPEIDFKNLDSVLVVRTNPPSTSGGADE